MTRNNVGAPSAEQIDEAIKELWLKVLRMSITDEATKVRSEIGDYINLIVPQLRVTYSIFYNPYLIPVIYYSALEHGKEGVILVFKELGFDINEFKRVSSWSKKVAYEAFETLKSIVNDSVMQKLNKGDIEFLDVDPQKKMFIIKINECGECWGIPNLNLRACHYTSGVFAGIWSSMVGDEFGAYEKNCIGRGDDSCVFIVQPIASTEHYNKVNEYLTINPRQMYHTKDVVDRARQHVKNALEGRLKRPKYGDALHLFDYQLRLLNSLSEYPQEYGIAQYHAGYKFGTVLTLFLQSYYGVEGMKILESALPNYYETLGFAKVASVESTKNGFKITMKEVADCAGLPEELAPHNFLCGELAGVASGVLGREMSCGNSKCRVGKDKICEFKIF